jgi:hypothetical protein
MMISRSNEMPFYHVSTAQLIAGQLLQPGAWGKQWRQFGKNGRALSDIRDGFILAWEIGLETARRQIAPNAPSRLECVFACNTTVDAAAFQTRFRPGAATYEVEPASEASPIFVADYDLITSSSEDPFLDVLVDRSIRYWTSRPQGIAEVLIGGAARVLRRM